MIAGLIRGLKVLAWTAVKISYHSDQRDSQDALAADELPAHLDFLLSEESNPQPHRDTSLYLAAGARRALWLRARDGGLARALPSLLEALERDEHVIVESNSLMSFLEPAAFLMVVDGSRADVKASARQFLACADAFVAVRRGPAPCVRPTTTLQVPRDRPVFPVSAGEWSNPELCRYVSERLASTPGADR